MPTIAIETEGCRSCTLCVDICPTEVLELAPQTELAEVKRPDDCIGCTSCQYLCPSRCLTVGEYVPQRPFFRLEDNRQLVERFLQAKTAEAELGEADWQEALRDVRVRLRALGDSVTQTMGRGQKAVGRKAGALAASHLPEMYEEAGVEDVLARLKDKFRNCFDFEPSVSGGGAEIGIHFSHCALSSLVREAGEKEGDALLCGLFHEYWAGLLGAFANNSYTLEMTDASSNGCSMKLHARK